MDKDMKLRKFIATTIREYLNENYGNDIWFHGTNKEFIKPKRVVGEFGNMGGFFLTKNINFAKAHGKYIKKFKLNKDIKIFDFDNEDHFLLYAEEVSKKTKLPNIGILHYAILLYGYSEIKAIEFVLKIIYPEIKNNIFNTVMDDTSNKYDEIQCLIRKKRLYRDYQSIEENDKTIYDAGFDASFVWENKNKNIQVFNLDKITSVD